MGVNGQLKLLFWGQNYTHWQLVWISPDCECQVNGLCGAYGVCNQQNITVCSCADGFEPKSLKDWALSDHSDGCVRKSLLRCDSGGEDTFSVIPIVHVPDNAEALEVLNIDECRLSCLSNCSCVVYFYVTSCLIWRVSLLNLKQFPSNNWTKFHFRISGSTQMVPKSKSKKLTSWIIVGAAGLSIVLCVIFFFMRHKQSGAEFEAVEGWLTVFKYQDLHSATKNFSQKLGEGGFGSVFKGTLPSSEYRTNGSLESLLFGNSTVVLDWKTRFNIAVRTARGLACLHERCRECIIHCDIKPENILLDAEYNPRVADFGLAKLLG